MSDEYLIVTEDIPANNGTVYAYRAGDRITKEAVEQNGWQGYVSMPKAVEPPPTTKK